MAQVSPVVASSSQPADRPASRVSSFAILLAAWSFAVAQPLYEQMRQHPVFLRDIGAANGVLWTIIVTIGLVVPLVLWSLVMLCGLAGRAAGWWALVAAQATLWMLFAMQVTRPLPPSLGIPAALSLAATVTVLTERFARVRQCVAVAAFGAVVFPAMFVFQPQIRTLALPSLPRPPSPAGAGNPVPVVFVILDEFSGTTLWDRDRQIDSARFPSFAQLARDGVWFRNATSVHGETAAALPALLSGRYPPEKPGTGFAPSDHLFSVLIDQHGYDGLVLEPLTRWCNTPRLREIDAPLPDAFQWRSFTRTLAHAYLLQVVPLDAGPYLPPLPTAWYGIGERPVDSRQVRGVAHYPWNRDRDLPLRHFVHGAVPSDVPSLHFLHVVLPHMPYVHDPEGRVYAARDLWDFPRPRDMVGGGSGDDADRWPDDPLFVAQARQRYLWQTRYADRFIGQLRDKLIAEGLYNRCLLMVMADHGVSLRPGERRRTVTAANQLDVVSIPLFVKPPGPRKGRVSDECVESVDVFATVLDVLKIADPPLIDGQSLLGEYRPRPMKRFSDIKGLRLLPGDYPRNASRDDWPILSADVDREARRLSDPGGITGRAVPDFAQGPAADVKVQWLPGGIAGQERIAGAALYFPGQVIVPERLASPVSLALALDGRIAAVTRTYQDPIEAGLFQFLVPSEQHPQPAERTELFVIDVHDGEVSLRRCEWPASQ